MTATRDPGPRPRLPASRATRRLRAALVIALLGPAAAAAEDRWTDPAPGVRHLSRADSYPYDNRPAYLLEALVVDLDHPAVSIVATSPERRGGTVTQFADALGLAAAWNTNFFNGSLDSCGLMMGEGRVWERAYQHDCHASVGFGAENQARIFTQPEPLGPPPEGWVREVATGKPELILENGEPRFRYGCGSNCAYHPRTGIGLDASGRRLFVVVVDGRRADSVGAGLDDLANLMRDLGAHTAINLDGGGSSTLYVRGDGGVVNRPSDGGQRSVCCHMGVRVDDGARWYGASLTGQSDTPAEVAPGDAVEVWARYRNTGRRTWRADGDQVVRLGTREPTDRGSALADESWPQPNRTPPVAGAVGPGDEGEFRFVLRAGAPGDYEEVFAPVAEGAAWMDQEPVRFRLRVVGTPVDRDAGPGRDGGVRDGGGSPVVDASVDGAAVDAAGRPRLGDRGAGGGGGAVDAAGARPDGVVAPRGGGGGEVEAPSGDLSGGCAVGPGAVTPGRGGAPRGGRGPWDTLGVALAVAVLLRRTRARRG